MDNTYKWHIRNVRDLDDAIISSKRENQMGDQLIFISYHLKFNLVYVTIYRHSICTGVPIDPFTKDLIKLVFIANCSSCTTTELSKLLTFHLTAIKSRH